MSNFLYVPLDIKTYIFDYLLHRADQQAVCRTCKDFHIIMLKQIYQTITLVDDIPMSKLSNLLSMENPGIRYVRHIRVVPSSGERQVWDGRRTKSSDDVLHLLANQLPRNCLLSFEQVLPRTMHLSSANSVPASTRSSLLGWISWTLFIGDSGTCVR